MRGCARAPVAAGGVARLRLAGQASSAKSGTVGVEVADPHLLTLRESCFAHSRLYRQLHTATGLHSPPSGSFLPIGLEQRVLSLFPKWLAIFEAWNDLALR